MRTTVPLVAALLICAPAAAEEPLVDRVQPGSGALMFMLGGLLAAPGVLDQVGVGGRYFTSDRIAWRGAVGIQYDSSRVDPDSGSKVETTDRLIALQGALEYLLYRSPTVFLYTGGLARLSFGGGADKRGDVERDRDSFGVGLGGLLGANYFFTQHVSVGAEYQLVLERISRSFEDDRDETETSFGTGSVGFNLAFWWL